MTNDDLPSEIEEYTTVHTQRRRLLPRAALVGLAAGLLASLFRLSLAGADGARNALIGWAHRFPAAGWLFPVLFGAAGAAVSLWLVRTYSPEAKGSGIPHLKAVAYRFRVMDWRRLLPIKFVAGVLAIGSGLALGREGPTVQMGGATGDMVAGWLKAAPGERRTLIAAGAGAGLAAAFNAPLSGLTFVLEEVQRDFHPIVFAATFVACVISDIVARALTSADPVFSVPSYPAQPLGTLPFFALLGVAAGLTGVLFSRGLITALNRFGRATANLRFGIAALAGAAAGITGWFYPFAVSGGQVLSEAALAGKLVAGSIPLWFLLRYGLTVLSYGTGTAGGIFAPMLALGALVGLGVGQAGHALAPQVVTQPAVFAVVGMAAYFTAVVRAPLTGILLIVEMTGSYAQMLPLLVACFCAYATAELLKALPIYEELLERDLSSGDESYSLKAPLILDLTIEPGSPFEGQVVRSLGLPPGCVLVRVVSGGRELVPTASTRLEAYNKITAVIAPEAERGVERLREGCKARKKAAGE